MAEEGVYEDEASSSSSSSSSSSDSDSGSEEGEREEIVKNSNSQRQDQRMVMNEPAVVAIGSNTRKPRKSITQTISEFFTGAGAGEGISGSPDSTQNRKNSISMSNTISDADKLGEVPLFAHSFFLSFFLSSFLSFCLLLSLSYFR